MFLLQNYNQGRVFLALVRPGLVQDYPSNYWIGSENIFGISDW